MPAVAAAAITFLAAATLTPRAQTVNFDRAPRVGAMPIARQIAPNLVTNDVRRLATIREQGKSYVLYASPTRSGSFCSWWITSGGSRMGACRGPGPDLQLQASGPRFAAYVTGSFDRKDVARVAVRLATGAEVDVPFVWVTKPIGAGLFLFHASRRSAAALELPAAVTLYDANGQVVETITL